MSQHLSLESLDLDDASSTISKTVAKSRMLVYQRVFSLLQEISAISNSELYNNLDAQYDSMAAEDPVAAIVKSLDSRKALLQFARALGIYDNSRLRDALREDEERIATCILAILDSGSDRASVLRLEGEPAQSFLDVVQNVGAFTGADYRLG
ncbi:hypothetical protein C8R45DRAFT_564714 [Mycena sanguinolenta]|nr:hypothetical protein C8R45DRAFT_564714 [Mycena sanguinolenta]